MPNCVSDLEAGIAGVWLPFVQKTCTVRHTESCNKAARGRGYVRLNVRSRPAGALKSRLSRTQTTATPRVSNLGKRVHEVGHRPTVALPASESTARNRLGPQGYGTFVQFCIITYASSCSLDRSLARLELNTAIHTFLTPFLLTSALPHSENCRPLRRAL